MHIQSVKAVFLIRMCVLRCVEAGLVFKSKRLYCTCMHRILGEIFTISWKLCARPDILCGAAFQVDQQGLGINGMFAIRPII